jgi:hypothetical protein
MAIRFEMPEMDLREIGIVATSLRRAINSAILSFLPTDIDEVIWLATRARFDDPLFASLRVEELSRGSLRALCRLRLSPKLRKHLAVGGRDLMVFLIGMSIWAIARKAQPSHDYPPPLAPPPVVIKRIPDAGPGVRTMVRRLTETDKPWELTLTDKQTGYEITVRSQ